MTDDDALEAIDADLGPRTAPGWKVDPHPGDVAHPERYEPARRDDYPDDALAQSARARQNADNGSPMVYVRLCCASCGRMATFYGHEDDAPSRLWRCDRCDVLPADLR